MFRTNFILLFILLCPLFAVGQGETSNWYFGNGAGITFNNDGSVDTVTDGQLDTFEGCATISDSFGGLLFYTDGIVVYNQDHAVMENGNGLFGDPSSTQSALIVPKPGNPDVFYIFTVDTSVAQNDPDRGLNYSTVDISLNDGKGSVIQKNIPLLADCSEKIAAIVKDCSDQSIWILTLASIRGTSPTFNTFHAFEVNTTGVVFPSVKSTFDDLAIEDGRGYLKLTPDGTKLVSANASFGLYIYDFDTTTGTASNQQQITISANEKSAYGVEFSPSSQYLYTHNSNDIQAASGHRSSLLQYDLLAPDISASEEILDNRSIYRGALQLGANGKIYRTVANSYFEGTPFLSVINDPDQKGMAANYEHNAISLNGKNATQGLPPFIQSFFNKEGLLKNNDGTTSSSLTLCSGENFTLEAENILGAIYSWEKDNIPITNSGNLLQITSALSTDSGKYRLTITPSDPSECPIIGEALIKVVPLPEANDFELQQCDVDTSDSTDGITLIDLEQASYNKDYKLTFYESAQDRDDDKSIINPEKYTNTQAFIQIIFYKATNTSGCEDFGEITLIINPTVIELSAFSPVMVCDENPDDGVLESTFNLETIRDNNYPDIDVAFYKNLEDVALEENPLSGNFKTTNTTLYVRIENANQCQAVEELELIVNPLPHIILEDTYQVCTDVEELLIFEPSGFDSYKWYNINNGQMIGNTEQVSINTGGDYRLEVGIAYTNNEQIIVCTSIHDFVVTVSNRAQFQEIDINDLSDRNSLEVIVSGDGNYEYSLDGFTYNDTALFENVTPGFYTVFVRDKKGCGISEEEIAVIGFPKFFTPNGDGSNDYWQIIGAGRDLVSGDITIYDRYGTLVKQISANDIGWDGTFNNGKKLPASDYWFSINLSNKKQFKGHFALKR